jgi:mRNA-degrading endonuclease RelE of RelBE toxin-antitoxin system
MRYRVKFNKKVRKFIDKHREISSKIYLKADLLAENKIETLDIKKLK